MYVWVAAGFPPLTSSSEFLQAVTTTRVGVLEQPSLFRCFQPCLMPFNAKTPIDLNRSSFPPFLPLEHFVSLAWMPTWLVGSLGGIRNTDTHRPRTDPNLLSPPPQPSQKINVVLLSTTTNRQNERTPSRRYRPLPPFSPLLRPPWRRWPPGRVERRHAREPPRGRREREVGRTATLGRRREGQAARRRGERETACRAGAPWWWDR